MRRLTDRQQECLSFIMEARQDSGLYPTQAEIASHFSFSRKASFDLVKALEAKGMIENVNGRITLSRELRRRYDPRMLSLFDPYPDNETGRIAETGLGEGEFFAMVIHTEDMKNAGLIPSDTAVFRKTSKAENGSIVLARCGDGVLVRRYYKRSDGITELIPENDTMGKIVTAQAEVLAVLVKSLRSYK